MLQYIVKRLLGLVPTLLIVGIMVFLLVHLLPGIPHASPPAPTRRRKRCSSYARISASTARCRSSSCASSGVQ